MLSGNQMVIQSLIDEGVKHVFGYPGGAVLHIYDALHQQDQLNHFLVRHEQAAGHMADANHPTSVPTIAPIQMMGALVIRHL